MALRWWPPLLHLTLLAVVLPLAAWRLDAISGTGPAPPSGGQVTASAGGPAADAAATATGLAAPAAIDLAALAARPLFAENRQGRNVTAAPTAPASPTAPPDRQLRMLGFINDGTRSKAILAIGDALSEEVVAEGDKIAGMTILRITPNSLTLTTDDEEITINMFDQ